MSGGEWVPAASVTPAAPATPAVPATPATAAAPATPAVPFTSPAPATPAVRATPAVPAGSAAVSETKPFAAREFLRTCTASPGIYQMLDSSAGVLYVGKAKNLRKRLSSYFRSPTGLAPKTRALVRQIADIRVVATHTEAEALLLEANLIKRHRPRYNILLRDDKSYPYIFLSGHGYPQLGIHRGARKKGMRYFGPYPSATAVRETLNLLQKLFLVRQCEDSVFAHRTRPCLQHQIGRCSAPCVGLVTPADYAADVDASVRFLAGDSAAVIADLVARMEQASAELRFERAAQLRDQIAQLRQISEQQYVAGGEGNADVFALAREGQTAALQIFSVRHGQNLGNTVRYPKLPEDTEDPAIMAAALAQYYADREPPALVLVSHQPEAANALTDLLIQRRRGPVHLNWHPRGDRARWLEMALRNAELALRTRLAGEAGQRARWQALAEVLLLDPIPERIECFDISHTQGEGTVASCVVFSVDGPCKSDYRRYNIAGITPGDDYAAMRQALDRRYSRILHGEGKLPDVLLIDGGKGQVTQANEVLANHAITSVKVMGVAKGPERRAGMETLVLSGLAGPSILPPHSAALHLIQQVRDEAHRFALTGHRQRRAKTRKVSRLEAIQGLGPKRRSALLRHFGGLQGVARAGVEELAKVPGISRSLAQAIYDGFHES